MRSSASVRRLASLAALIAVCTAAAPMLTAQAQGDALFQEAMRREALLREQIDTRGAGSGRVPLLERARTLTQTYEDIARLFPRADSADDALWQGALLAAHVYFEFGEAEDRATALSLMRALESTFPDSAFVKQIPAQTARLNEARGAGQASGASGASGAGRATAAGRATGASGAAAAGATPPPTPARPTRPARAVPSASSASSASSTSSISPAPAASPALSASRLRGIKRQVLPGAVRITLDLEREAPFFDERIDGPPRVVIDLQNTRPSEALRDRSVTYADDVVRAVRVGRQQDARTRVVLDLQGAARHSVYALYNPYRVVIDVERPALGTAPTPAATPAAAPAPVPPPAKNGNGTFSLSRQLGLGVGRVVIDPGHGGNDPGAQVRGLSEAELTLDVALRLEKLLEKQPGVEVILTRRSNHYVSLEERTAIANRAEADLFLSIHTNASGDSRAAGIETYFLNFASNPAAEAVAARENAGSSRTMRELQDIVKAIALNNKLDESRDFAEAVQSAMVARLKRVNTQVRNLGVKQAPFMVLIGATMPGVLAEISFITNAKEAALLRTSRYRDQIAEALFAGIMNYQRALKKADGIARLRIDEFAN